MCCRSCMHKTHRTRLHITAIVLAVILVAIIAYEVYAVTLNYGCSKYRRHPVLRDNQELRLLAQQKSEVNSDQQPKLRVTMIANHPDGSDTNNQLSAKSVNFNLTDSLRGSVNGDRRPTNNIVVQRKLMKKQMIDRLIQDFENAKTAAVDHKVESRTYQTSSLVNPLHQHNQTQTAQSSHVIPTHSYKLLTTVTLGNSQGNTAQKEVMVNGQLLNQGSKPKPRVVIISKSDLLNSVSKKSRKAITNPTTQATKIRTTSNINPATIPPIPYMGNYKCRDNLCSEFFSRLDKLFYDHCTDRLIQHHEKQPDLVSLEPGKCHFMNGNNRAAVALASFPGSGNTWIRGLLEQATGICTGAVYGDYGIRSAGFNGEGLRTGTVIAIKTHKTEPNWTDVNMPYNNLNSKAAPSYGAAILLIRNPMDALVAEWNREASKKVTYPGQNGSSIHVKYVGEEYFRENPQWNSFVIRKTKVWQQHFVGWVVGGRGHPVLVVRYEDFKTDVIGQTKRMLDFLKVPYSEEELRKRMEVDFGAFHRKHHADFEHFTPKQRSYVQQAIAETLGVLKERNNGDTLGVADYLDKPEV